MRDIVGEAILFDMYYAAQDPIVLAGEKREPPKVEELPVTEGTPQFRNIFVNNVVASGAEKAIFVRGLPEMNVKDLVLQNLTIQAKRGLDMTEGSNITLRNVRLITTETNPVLYVHNSKNITLDNILYNDAELLLNVSGEKSANIRLNNTNPGKAKQKIKFEFGATEKALVSQ